MRPWFLWANASTVAAAPCAGSGSEAVTVAVLLDCPETSWSRLFPSGGPVRMVRSQFSAPLGAAAAQHLLAQTWRASSRADGTFP